jgi:hypothetical protein
LRREISLPYFHIALRGNGKRWRKFEKQLSPRVAATIINGMKPHSIGRALGIGFFLPVVVFSSTLWRTRASYAHGPDHRTFLVTAGIVLVFLYLSLSSFWRARRR